MFRRLHGTLTKKEHPDIQFMQGKITNAEEIEYLNGKEEGPTRKAVQFMSYNCLERAFMLPFVQHAL